MAKTERTFVGLYSGAAADGIDAALVGIDGSGEHMTVRQTHCVHRPMPELLHARVQSAGAGWAMPAADFARLDRDMGDLLADACEALLKEASTPAKYVAGIGLIGHCVGYTRPSPSSGRGATWELGSPATLCRRMGLAVAAGFAATDLAAGGVGGPVWAWPDWLMFRDDRLSRVVVHLGGIATVTFIGSAAAASDVVAYDTGPGTILIDYLAHQLFQRDADTDGALAARGGVNPALLNELLSAEHFRRTPPKRTCADDWSGPAAQRLEMMAGKHLCEAATLLTTVTELTARTVAAAVLAMTERPHEVILTGGGALDIHLAGRIRALLSPCSTYACERYGLAMRAHGATAAAVLAAARIDALPAHCHRATGAAEPAVLGSLWAP
jgi:anhydro-N-acetylmuramic acid kinase